LKHIRLLRSHYNATAFVARYGVRKLSSLSIVVFARARQQSIDNRDKGDFQTLVVNSTLAFFILDGPVEQNQRLAYPNPVKL